MISIHTLHNIITSIPVAVLGGGPSLGDDIAKVPLGSVMIAVNHHALRYTWASYMVFRDDPTEHPSLFKALKGYQGVKVSPQIFFSDVDLSVNWWDGLFSSYLATWFACWLGCNPVLLCGMDCYQNPRPSDVDIRDNAYKMPLEQHLKGWKEAFRHCSYPERIRAISGPLVKIFGAFP